MSYEVIKNATALIDIRSWIAALGAEHFMADLYHGEVRRLAVRYKMSRSQAANFNKKDGGSTYSPGDKTSRFFTEEAAIKKAVKKALKLWPDLKAIIAGEFAVAQPQQIVWCTDKELMNDLNIIWTAVEDLYKETYDPWTKYETKMETYCTSWEALLTTFIEKETP